MIQQSAEALEAFAKSYEKSAKYSIGPEGRQYLRNAQVWAFYSADNELLGGYAISTQEMNLTFRYFDLLEKGNRDKVLEVNPHLKDFGSIAEITFTYLNQKASWWQKIQILSSSLSNVLQMGKKYILGGGKIQAFNNRMKYVLANTIYEGEELIYGKKVMYKIFCGVSDKIKMPLILKALIRDLGLQLMKKITKRWKTKS
jgi:hypothetical protein